MCVDYRRPNAHLVKNRFPMPTFNEIVDELGGTSVFSKLDHRSGYHQIHIKVMSIRRHFKHITGKMNTELCSLA
jgi:hypothetical protein